MPTGKNDDKSQDFDADYDFSKMDFGDDDAEGQNSKSSATLAGDDDVFAGFGGGNDASGDFGGDDDDDNFEFEDMPDPNRPAAVSGNVDDEFADIDAAPVAPSRAAVPPAAADEADPFAEEEFEAGDGEDSDDFSDDFDSSDDDEEVTETVEGDDLFDADDEILDDTETADAQGSGKTRSPIMKFALPIAAVLGVCFIGYTAYSYVTPMIFGSSAPQRQAQSPLPPSNANFPTKLPSQGLPTQVAQQPAAPAAPVQQAPIGNSIPVMNPPVAPPSAMTPGTLPAVQQPQMAQQIPTPKGFPGGIVLPDTIQPSATPKAAAPEDDLVAGGDRGGITAMKEAASQGAVAGSFEKRFAALEAQVDGLKKRIDSLTDRIESGMGAVVTSNKSSNDDALVAEPVKALPDDIVPPLKPVVIEGVSLKGVSRDVAWVSTVSGVVEVKEGDNIPNAGDVVKVRSYGGDWIVVTTQGIVVR